MDKKRTILIITANDYLAYQPSILNLYDALDPVFDATIISFEPEFIGRQKPDGRKTIYLKIPALLKDLVKKVDYLIQLSVKLFKPILPFLSFEWPFYQRLQMHYLKDGIRGLRADEYLAVDIPALTVSQSVFGPCHFFSLELSEKDPYRKRVRTKDILSVIIQNVERYKFLFGETSLPVYFVQNAPVFREEMIRSYERHGLIWAGTILKRFAVLDCIEYIRHYPDSALTLKGGAEKKTEEYIKEHYAELLGSGALVIDRSYSTLYDLIDYLSHFRIGFCFYSWELIRGSINYQTAPSGKLFMYLAAGVPVVACNIPGFQFVREFGAGVLIDDYQPATIFNAIREIGLKYGDMQTACYRAAARFSFDKTIAPFVGSLQKPAASGPLVSICIPAYKRRDFVTRLLDSIAIQRFRDFEVVVTDDSPDLDIRELCDQYQGQFPLSYHRNPSPLGTPANWNEAIGLAKGQWIKLMHDDDWFASEDSLGIFVDAISASAPGDLIFSSYYNVHLPGGRQELVSISPFRFKALKKNPATLFALNGIGPPSVTLIRKNGSRGYDARMKWLVDIDFYIHCLATGSLRHIAKPLVNIGVSSQQVTREAFGHRPVEIRESFLLMDRMGAAALGNLLVYDSWWRLMRNLDIRHRSDLEDAGYTGPVPAIILSMIAWQRNLPRPLLKNGFFSKAFMFLHYLLHRNLT